MVLEPQQLAVLERRLEEDHRRLLEEVRDELEASGNQQYAELVNRDPADSGDAAAADLLAILNLAEIDRHIAHLRDIEAARARIADGTYGSCADCGQEIGYERLLAYPAANRCVSCQRLHERLVMPEGPPTL